MWIAAIEFDILVGAVHSLKAKRSLMRPLIAELRRRFQVSVAEVGYQQLHQRALIGVAIVGADARHAGAILDQVERMVADRPEMELLSARRTLQTMDDE